MWAARDATLVTLLPTTPEGALMKCSKCRHENRTGAKFCEECAAPLARTCPNCGSAASTTAKFCPECAHPLLAPVNEPRFTSPEAYTRGSTARDPTPDIANAVHKNLREAREADSLTALERYKHERMK